MIPLVLLFSCASLIYLVPTTAGYNQLCDTWKGSSINDLIRSWGPPSQVLDMAGGGKLYTFTRQSFSQSPTYAKTNYNTSSAKTTITGGEVERSWCTTSFETDSRGTIVFWRWEGNSCEAILKRPEE